MTTVVGISGDGYAVLCADSRISTIEADGYTSSIQTLASSMPKIASVGSYHIGISGDVRAINIITYAFQPPNPPPALRGKKLDEFFTTKFIPSLRACYEANGYSYVSPDSNNSRSIEAGSCLLVAVNRTIYQVDNDYSWFSDSGGIYAIGTGSAYALGALGILCPKPPTLQQAKKHAIKAIAIAAKNDPHSGFPYNVVFQDMSMATPSTRTKVNAKRTKPE